MYYALQILDTLGFSDGNWLPLQPCIYGFSDSNPGGNITLSDHFFLIKHFISNPRSKSIVLTFHRHLQNKKQNQKNLNTFKKNHVFEVQRILKKIN